MTLDPPSGTGTGPGSDTGSASEGGTLVFISDASAEAERLSAALRARGYALFDVPLGLLVSRVAVQRPALVICDADAPGAIETVQRVREVGGGQRVDVIFLGEPGRTLEQQRDALEREASGTFARPVDPDVLTRKVEALIGAPSHGRALQGANRSPVLVAATRRPYRFEGPTSFRPPPTPSGPPTGDSVAPPSSPTTTGAMAPSTVPPPSHPGAPAAVITQARLSPELEMLLGRAEARVRQGPQSPQLPERLSPEAELDAILPPDLLAALDEPLEVDDDDDDERSESGAGTAGGSEAGSHRTGHGSVGGTGTGSAQARAETNAGGSRPPLQREAIPEPAASIVPSEPPLEEEAPITPPALRARHQPPASLRTALEPGDARDNTNAPTAPPPAQPSEPPSFGTGPSLPLSEPPETVGPQPSTRPPRVDRELEQPAASLPPAEVKLEVPAVVGVGDSVVALARAVRARFSGAIAFEDPSGIRRVVFRDGDFVTAASGAAGESLVEFLAQRGDLSQDTVTKLGRKLPQFGRHAGAALIAQGHLRQDELWNVLRAHAEWIIARVAGIDRGGASVEHDLPARLAAEPGVFGGATGAEVLLDVVRRVVTADEALRRLGGPNVRLVPGPSHTLLGECALSPQENEWVAEAQALSVGESVQRVGTRDFATVLYVLLQLGVLRSSSAPPRAPARGTKPEPIVHDALDDAALRARIAARRALVDEGDYFALLGVSREATGYDVRRAYSELRREFEPERVLTAATADLRDDVALINEVLEEAFDILGDDLRRERYRRALDAAPR